MTRFLLITTLLLGCSHAYAGWVALEKRHQAPGKQTVDFDPDTICQGGSWVSLWQLANAKWMKEPQAPKFLSAKTHKQFDCAKGRFRVLAVVEYSREMTTSKSAGGYIENGNWQ
jgi:hypothetical protein